MWFIPADRSLHWLTHTGTSWTLSWCLWDRGTRASLWTTTLTSDDTAHRCSLGRLNVAREALCYKQECRTVLSKDP